LTTLFLLLFLRVLPAIPGLYVQYLTTLRFLGCFFSSFFAVLSVVYAFRFFLVILVLFLNISFYILRYVYYVYRGYNKNTIKDARTVMPLQSLSSQPLQNQSNRSQHLYKQT